MRHAIRAIKCGIMKHSIIVIFTGFLIFFGLSNSYSYDKKGAVVLFDQGHGQVFLIERQGDLDLSSFANLFKDSGFEIRTGLTKISPELLSGVDSIIISGPFKPFSSDEIIEIKKFIERGGSLAIMIHVAPIIKDLLNNLGLAFTPGSINETNDIIGAMGKDFLVRKLEKHPLFDGLKSFAVYGSWGLLPQSDYTSVIAKTGANAWIDRNNNNKFDDNDIHGEFGIIVTGNYGKGKFIVFGDDALFQNRFLKEGNLQLGKNLVRWLFIKDALHL